ncbi:hypothetical protein FRC09_001927 [Ceratobasidium sp. 395]|nr:hypothetical protein FRC09_001927 [Ceratobasidium sp. 395]
MQDFEEWMQWCSEKTGYKPESEGDIDWEDDESEPEIGSDTDSDAEVKSEFETETGDLGEFEEGDEDLEFEYGPEHSMSAGLEDHGWDDDNESCSLFVLQLQDVAQATQFEQGYVEGEGKGRGEKRKHPVPDGEGPIETGDDLTRSLPRPRLQDSHALSDLQKINQQASLRRQSLRDISTTFGLEQQPFFRAIKRNSYLASLPLKINEYTLADTWDALRTYLYPHIPNPKTKMQRIRAKPIRGQSVAQCDPVFYAPSSAVDPYWFSFMDSSVSSVASYRQP